MEEDNTKKSIAYNIVKTTTKKKLIEQYNKSTNKKRIQTENWCFNKENYAYENQIKIIKKIFDNGYKSNDYVSNIALQQINRKIYSYKQQDIIKKRLNIDEFITAKSIINKMVECKLKCYYCSCEMNVLYDISREMKQWTVDRIDNNLGHNLTNYYLACLECNLKRRRRNDDKFLFTKQMKLVKLPSVNNKDIDSSLV